MIHSIVTILIYEKLCVHIHISFLISFLNLKTESVNRLVDLVKYLKDNFKFSNLCFFFLKKLEYFEERSELEKFLCMHKLLLKDNSFI